jgi:hypothetical protein
MNTKTVIGFIVITIIISSDVDAIESRMRLATSQPVVKQNLPVSELELSYLPQSKSLFSSKILQWYPAYNLGSLIVADDTVLSAGASLGLALGVTDDVYLFAEGGGVWLSEYQFGERGVAYKDYGGPLQFKTRLGLDYHVNKHWSLGYAYLHMSNGERYATNPALNAHSLHLVYEF